jgi:hypothetical protein
MVHKEQVNSPDLEANIPNEKTETAPDKASGGFVAKIASSLGTVASPLRKTSQSNDSGVFGVADKHGVEARKGGDETAKMEEERKKVYRTDGIKDGWSR